MRSKHVVLIPVPLLLVLVVWFVHVYLGNVWNGESLGHIHVHVFK